MNFGISRCLCCVPAIKSGIEYVSQSTFAESTSPCGCDVAFHHFRRSGTRACCETFASREILVLRLHKRKTSGPTPENVSTRAVRACSLAFQRGFENLAELPRSSAIRLRHDSSALIWCLGRMYADSSNFTISASRFSMSHLFEIMVVVAIVNRW